MKPVTIAIAGCANPHVFNYLRNPRNFASDVKLVAISDSSQERREVAAKLPASAGVPTYTDYCEMLDRHPEVEAVMVGSDNAQHFEMIAEAMRRDLHIYSMKVVSMSPSECRALKELQQGANKTNRRFQVELELRFLPQFEYARELIQSGRLGAISSISLSNISQSPICYFPNWGSPELSYGKRVPLYPGATICRGGALTDHPHPFDLIRWITGAEFSQVTAFSARNQRSYLEVEDHVTITGELTDGCKVMINPSYSNLEERSEVRRLLWPKSLECNLKITGEHGIYMADYFDHPAFILGPSHASPNRLIVDGTPYPAKKSLLGSFAGQIRGEPSIYTATLADGIAAINVMNAAYESIHRGSTVFLNEFSNFY